MNLKQSKQQSAFDSPELEYLGQIVGSEGVDTKKGCCGQTLKCAQLPLCVNAAERNFGIDQHKLLAMVHAIKVWQCCFEVINADMLTVDNPPSCLQTQTVLFRQQTRWS